MKSKIKFENAFAKQLYLEISGIQDMKTINRGYISLDYIWKVWQKVYKANYGCTSYIIDSNKKGE